MKIKAQPSPLQPKWKKKKKKKKKKKDKEGVHRVPSRRQVR